MNNLLPEIFCDLFVSNSSVYSHDMRQKEKLQVIPHRLIVRQHSIKIYGVKLWNLLSQHIIESPTYYIFKRHYKRYLLEILWLICYCVVNYNSIVYILMPPPPSPLRTLIIFLLYIVSSFLLSVLYFIGYQIFIFNYLIFQVIKSYEYSNINNHMYYYGLYD